MKNFTLVFLISVSVAQAATFYVDYASGSDTNSGTSTATAWKHCPGDATAADNSSSASLSPGDIVMFKGGVEYIGSGIDLAFSGATNSVITYDGTGTSWGAGRAVINNLNLADTDRSHFFAFNTGVSFVRLDGFELKNSGGYSDTNPVVALYNSGAATNTSYKYGLGIDMGDQTGPFSYGNGHNTNITLANLYIHNVGNWNNGIGWDALKLSGVGVSAFSSEYLTITNCEFALIGNQCINVAVHDGDDVGHILITGCYLHDAALNWGVNVKGGDQSTLHDIKITKTRFVNCPLVDFIGQNSDAPHLNSIFFGLNGGTNYWTNNEISRCSFSTTNTTFNTAGGTSCIYLSGGPSCDIVNNIFNHCYVNNGIVEISSMYFLGQVETIRVYNNTFVRNVGIPIENGVFNIAAFNLDVRNNLFVDESGVLANKVFQNYNSEGAAATRTDHNVYYSPDWDIAEKSLSIGLGAYFLPGLQILGWESNSAYADPLLVNTTSLPPTTRNLQPLTNSPAIGAGTNLSAIFTTDYAGNARPSTGNWTIGAYEAPATGESEPAVWESHAASPWVMRSVAF